MADNVVIDREEPKEVEMDFSHYLKRQISAVSNQRNFALALVLLTFLICSYIPTLRDDFVFGSNTIISYSQSNVTTTGPSSEEMFSVSKNNLANIMKELENYKKKAAEELQKRTVELEAKLEKVQASANSLASREAALKESAKALADQQAQLHQSTTALPVIPPLVCEAPPSTNDLPLEVQENKDVTRLLAELKLMDEQLAELRNERDRVKSVHTLSKSLAGQARAVDSKVAGLQQTIDTLQRTTLDSLNAVVVPTEVPPPVFPTIEEVKPLDEGAVAALVKREAESILAEHQKEQEVKQAAATAAAAAAAKERAAAKAAAKAAKAAGAATPKKTKPTTVTVTSTAAPNSASAAAAPIPSLDFALYSAGATVINSSNTYFPPALLVEERLKSALGSVGLSSLTQYVPENLSGGRNFYDRLKLNPGVGEPKDAISLGLAPGQCWPMEGTSGELVVQLSEPVKVESISIDHISSVNAKNIDSAPKRFQVYARESANGQDKLIVEGAYDINKPENIQNFAVKSAVDRPVSIVTLKVLSNSGNPDYTCLYRFRVHGTPATR